MFAVQLFDMCGKLREHRNRTYVLIYLERFLTYATNMLVPVLYTCCRHMVLMLVLGYHRLPPGVLRWPDGQRAPLAVLCACGGWRA